jgi:hypothetical protein
MAGGSEWLCVILSICVEKSYCKWCLRSDFFALRFELHGPMQNPPKIEIKPSKRPKKSKNQIHFHPTYPIPLQNGIKTIKIPG